MAQQEPNETAPRQDAGYRPIEYQFQDIRHTRREIDKQQVHGWKVREFADNVEAAARGAVSVLKLIEWDIDREDQHEMNPDTWPAPVLSGWHRESLRQLVTFSLEALTEQAYELKEWAYLTTPEGKRKELDDAVRLVEQAAALKPRNEA